MKTKIILSALSLAIASISFAHNKKPANIKTREILTSGAIHRIIVGNNVKVILVADDNYPAITVTGESDLLSVVTTKTDGDQLTLSSSKNLKSSKLWIHVPVKDLDFLELKADASVTVQGVLQCTTLKVLVNSGAHVALKSLGKVTIIPADDCEFVYERDESGMVTL